MPDRCIVLLTSPGLYGAMIINSLGRVDGLNLVGIALTNRVYKGKGPFATLVRFIHRCGFPYTAYHILVSNIAWAYLRMRGRPGELSALDSESIRYTCDINDAQTTAWLRGLAPDYVASFYFNQWIGREVREIPSIDCVNVHPSLLPALRGPDPLFRAMEQGIWSTGLTLHRVADQFDAGEALYQQPCMLSPQGSLLDGYANLIGRGSELLGEWLAGRLDRRLVSTSTRASYFGFPTPGEVREFRRRGHKLTSMRSFRRALHSIG